MFSLYWCWLLELIQLMHCFCFLIKILLAYSVRIVHLNTQFLMSLLQYHNAQLCVCWSHCVAAFYNFHVLSECILKSNFTIEVLCWHLYFFSIIVCFKSIFRLYRYSWEAQERPVKQWSTSVQLLVFPTATPSLMFDPREGSLRRLGDVETARVSEFKSLKISIEAKFQGVIPFNLVWTGMTGSVFAGYFLKILLLWYAVLF